MEPPRFISRNFMEVLECLDLALKNIGTEPKTAFHWDSALFPYLIPVLAHDRFFKLYLQAYKISDHKKIDAVKSVIKLIDDSHRNRFIDSGDTDWTADKMASMFQDCFQSESSGLKFREKVILFGWLLDANYRMRPCRWTMIKKISVVGYWGDLLIKLYNHFDRCAVLLLRKKRF